MKMKMNDVSYHSKRKDTAKEKRTELHCHTKMSYMGSVADVRDIITRAREWGWFSVAITDTHGIRAFPEAQRAVEFINREYWVELKNKYPDAAEEELNAIYGPVKIIYGMECTIKEGFYNVTLLVKNDAGLDNLYHLVSESHLHHMDKGIPVIPKELIIKYREGLLVGGPCESGELFEAVESGKSEAEIEDIVGFYDYLEICPLDNYIYNDMYIGMDGLDINRVYEKYREINRKITELGEKFSKPVVASGDVRFIDPEDEKSYRIICKAADDEWEEEDVPLQPPFYMRTTDEMLEEFSYLGEKKAYEVVVENPGLISESCGQITPVKEGKYYPVIDNAENDLKEICYREAHRMYGETLPTEVSKRLEQELKPITENGYASIYMILHKIIKKVKEDGQITGFRGASGSSLVAYLAGRSGINPLKSHYICPKCKYSDFDSDIVRRNDTGCGQDMPDRKCPECGESLEKHGFNIPFETFAGVNGNSESYFEINVPSDYQENMLKKCREIFGASNVLRPGRNVTVEDWLANMYADMYLDHTCESKTPGKIATIAEGLKGVFYRSSVYPGGFIIIPDDMDINTITPVQYAFDKVSKGIMATHFDYQDISHNLLRLYFLGHSTPAMLVKLGELTGTDPLKVRIDDPKILSLFSTTEALGISKEQIGDFPLGILGIPEFSSPFFIHLIRSCRPQNISDLIRMSALSHGTGVWKGNGEDLIREGKTLKDIICSRDDVMLFLEKQGMEREKAFGIMEKVRKGKGLNPGAEQDMRNVNVPEWYIESCKKIGYLFPQAHCAGYTDFSLRLAYYKIYHPEEFYKVWFMYQCDGGEIDKILQEAKLSHEKAVLYEDEFTGDQSFDLNRQIEKKNVAREMYARGISYDPSE